MIVRADDGWHVERGTECFHCHKPIGDGAYVEWNHYPVSIVLHPRCAQEFGAHLIKDGLLSSYPTTYHAHPDKGPCITCDDLTL
jgi:hypothetical protein